MDFPDTDGARGKPRPALVVLDSGDADVLVARVTSQNQQTAYDVRIEEWQVAGLRLASIVRIHKLATLHKSRIRHSIGAVSAQDRKTISRALSAIFSGW
jgi:mRNA interferase MazF